MEEKETPLKNSFPFYWEMYDLARKHLSQEDKANLFDVVCEYGFFRRELAEKTPMVGMIWGMLKKTYDNAFRQYDRCKKNGKEGAKHGVKGGRPRKKKPQEKPQVIYEYNELFEYIDNKGKINWEIFEKEIREFGRTQNIPKKRVEEFIEYTFNNWVDRADDLGSSKLYDRNGRELENWKGALINFAKTDYEGWKEENGLTRPKKTRRNK